MIVCLCRLGLALTVRWLNDVKPECGGVPKVPERIVFLDFSL
jgi:hypothetical protein